MWTCPVVLMTAQAGESLELVALRRASEVIFGAGVAWAFHWIADRIVGPEKAPPNEATKGNAEALGYTLCEVGVSRRTAAAHRYRKPKYASSADTISVPVT